MMAKHFARADRRFRRWEPYVGFLATTGVFSILGKLVTMFGDLGWPEALFLGTGAACAVSLSLAALLAGWQRFRPPPLLRNHRIQDVADWITIQHASALWFDTTYDESLHPALFQRDWATMMRVRGQKGDMQVAQNVQGDPEPNLQNVMTTHFMRRSELLAWARREHHRELVKLLAQKG